MENKIKIQNPCEEKWNSMSANKKGRFCSSCNKTVVDFTKMENSEIQKYFIENSNDKSICGYYKFNQVENNNTKYFNLKNRFERIKVKPIKIVALLLLSFLFTFSSCIMGKRAEEMPEEEIKNDSINNNHDYKSKLNLEKKKDSLKNQIENLKKNR
jgi:hypothetical protein